MISKRVLRRSQFPVVIIQSFLLQASMAIIASALAKEFCKNAFHQDIKRQPFIKESRISRSKQSADGRRNGSYWGNCEESKTKDKFLYTHICVAHTALIKEEESREGGKWKRKNNGNGLPSYMGYLTLRRWDYIHRFSTLRCALNNVYVHNTAIVTHVQNYILFMSQCWRVTAILMTWTVCIKQTCPKSNSSSPMARPVIFGRFLLRPEWSRFSRR